MRIHRVNATFIEFRLNATERNLLTQILGLYPVVPASHHTLSKTLTGRMAIENQRLLDEALAEQRASHKRRLNEWLATEDRFRTTKAGCILKLPRADSEWLLQVLNDIRIGNWLLLGSPEERLDPEEMDPQLHHLWAAMELSGMFQMGVLHALELPPAE